MNKLILNFLICITLASCSRKNSYTDIPRLHNYPDPEKCPPHVIRSYDEAKVKKLAKQAGMRPVDYLHHMNNKRYKTKVINREEK